MNTETVLTALYDTLYEIVLTTLYDSFLFKESFKIGETMTCKPGNQKQLPREVMREQQKQLMKPCDYRFPHPYLKFWRWMYSQQNEVIDYLSTGLIGEMSKLVWKYLWKCNEPRVVKTILEKKKKVRGLHYLTLSSISIKIYKYVIGSE